MACPECGCKETYQYSDGEDFDIGDELTRCAACGEIFDLGDEADEEDEVESASCKMQHKPSKNCWCEPEKVFVDPETGNGVYVHHETQ